MGEGLAYNRQERRERQVLGLEDFTEAVIAALETARAPEAAEFLSSGGNSPRQFRALSP